VAIFVLIPGAGADPRVYDATIHALRSLGHDGVAPPLPLGEPNAHPSDHAAAPGETAGEWWQNTRHGETIADLVGRHGPMSAWGAEALDEVFLHDVDPDVARAAERFNGAPGPGMFNEPWPHASWPDVTTRILCPREDRLFPWEFQQRVAGERLGLELDEIGGGHLPMLSRPAELAQRLVELAAQAR